MRLAVSWHFRHDLDPDALTEKERLAKRRYDAFFVFETMPTCVECGNPFDDNPGKNICRTCDDWLVRQPAPGLVDDEQVD
jgi:hypothetical protein